MTTGTNTPLTLSASLAIGALEALASSTSRIIWARAVSSPTRSARIFKKPLRLTEAPVSLSPGFLSTGRLSPVRADSSTADSPSSKIPSTGILWPGFTWTMSPLSTSSAGISKTSPSRSTKAVLGARAMSREMASEVLPLERVSRYFPRVIRARIMAAVSKYRFMA